MLTERRVDIKNPSPFLHGFHASDVDSNHVSLSWLLISIFRLNSMDPQGGWQKKVAILDAVGSSKIFFPTQNLERAY